MARASSRTLGLGVPPAYTAKLVKTKYEDTYVIVPIDFDLEIGGGPIIPPEVPPGGGGGGGGGEPGPGTDVTVYAPPEGTTPPADPLAPNYEWMILGWGDKTTSWAQVGPHMTLQKK